MRLPKFEYFEPKQISEAVSILQNEPAAKILAGGTDLLVNMKHRVERPPVLVNIKRLGDLDFIRQDNGDVRMGALTPLKRLYMTPLVMENLPGLAQAASSVGSYHHQVMGTLAGNICQQNRCMYFNQSQWWRSSRPTCFKAGGEICHVLNKKKTCYSTYCGDMAPALLVMNARIAITGPGGSRELPIEDLFSEDGKTPLRLNQAEILTEIIIPAESVTGICRYQKFANRDSIDFPIVGTAFWASEQKKEYRIAFTAVDRKPLRAQRVEAFLKGKKLDKITITEASGLAAGEAKPVKTSVYSPANKRRMMGLLFQRVVDDAKRRSIK
ncbi:MAG: FAD binding domain-containing protein [Deltaproteobacteria bacterium]|nr:MAG: FAD binding domain-containing protein [Deltaproteobacteria bacterium]